MLDDNGDADDLMIMRIMKMVSEDGKNETHEGDEIHDGDEKKSKLEKKTKNMMMVMM